MNSSKSVPNVQRVSSKLFMILKRNWRTFPVLLSLLCLSSCGRDIGAQRDHHFRRAQEYAKREKYVEAVIELQNAVHLDPNFAEGYVALGSASRRLGRYDEAAIAFRRSLELAPKQSKAAIELGEIYLMANAPGQARELAEDALRRDERDSSARLLLAKSYLGEKNFVQARAEFEKAKQLDPANPAIYLATGIAEIGIGNRLAAENRRHQARRKDVIPQDGCGGATIPVSIVAWPSGPMKIRCSHPSRRISATERLASTASRSTSSTRLRPPPATRPGNFRS